MAIAGVSCFQHVESPLRISKQEAKITWSVNQMARQLSGSMTCQTDVCNVYHVSIMIKKPSLSLKTRSKDNMERKSRRCLNDMLFKSV